MCEYGSFCKLFCQDKFAEFPCRAIVAVAELGQITFLGIFVSAQISYCSFTVGAIITSIVDHFVDSFLFYDSIRAT